MNIILNIFVSPENMQQIENSNKLHGATKLHNIYEPNAEYAIPKHIHVKKVFTFYILVTFLHF